MVFEGRQRAIVDLEPIRIDAVELRELKVPLVAPFETSGWREEEKGCIIVQVNGDGLTGFGECAVTAGPWYGPETTAGAWYVMENCFVPTVLKKEFASPADLFDSLSFVRGNNMAKAGFEMACYDLFAKREGNSLSKYLGGTKKRIESGVSVGIQKNARQLVDVVGGYLRQGYRRIKIKIKPGKDLDQVSTLREHFPKMVLMADANGAYEASNVEKLFKLDSYDLLMIEQPFAWDDLVEHANLQRALKTPICLDESVASVNDLKTALALRSCRILNLKPARVGGLTVSKTIHEICQTHNMPMWCGGLLETGIGRAHNVAIASLPGFVLPNDISASKRYFESDIIEPEFRLDQDGTITVPNGPGIGVDVVHEKLLEYTVRTEKFGS